jgi:U3 small nucleolar RNA-associated protein 14
VKEVLGRWDDVVEHHRTADQLEFPAVNTGVKVYETNIFSSVTDPKTEVEKKVFAMLQENGYTAKRLKVCIMYLIDVSQILNM